MTPFCNVERGNDRVSDEQARLHRGSAAVT